MITDTSVSLYQKVTTKSAKGLSVPSYATLTATFQANVQPVSLSQSQMSQWGVTDMAANAKKMFYYPNASVRMLDRIKDAQGDWYEVRGINQWGVPPFNHYEAILVPVQGES